MQSAEFGHTQERLSALYQAQLKEREIAFERWLPSLAAGSFSSSDFDTLQLAAHRLGGTGATYGYPKISEAASALESTMRAGARDHSVLAPLLEALLEEVRASLTASDSTVIIDEPPPASKPPRGGGGYKPLILLADDDPDIQRVVSSALGHMGNIRVATSGHDLLRTIRMQRVDVLILDFHFPDMNAFELLANLRKTLRKSQTQVMMLSAMRDAEQISRLLLAGANGYVVKPFQPPFLLKRVEFLLRRTRPAVMIADDDPLIREILKVKLERLDVSVLLAANGDEALAMARLERPHAIVLDRGMPRTDGLTVLSEIRRDNDLCETPVLVLTAYSTRDDVTAGYERGANDYVTKPFVPDEVVDRCVALLRKDPRLDI